MKTLYVILRGVTSARLRVPTKGDVRNTPLEKKKARERESVCVTFWEEDTVYM